MKTLDYQTQATDLLNKFGIKLEIEFIKQAKHFPDDKEERDIYKMTLNRGHRRVSFEFGNCTTDSGFKFISGAGKIINIPTTKSEREILLKNPTTLKRLVEMTIKFSLIASDKISTPKIPTAYDLLACLQKYEIGTFEDFCSDFGYDEDSISAMKTYEAVKKEYIKVCTIFNDAEMEELKEIQ